MKVSNIILAVVLAVGFAMPASANVDNGNLDSEITQGAFQSRRD